MALGRRIPITIDWLELSEVDNCCECVKGWIRFEVDDEDDEYMHSRDAVIVDRGGERGIGSVYKSIISLKAGEERV